MSATDELRRLLDELGVEHYDGVERTLWGKDASGYRFSADELTIGSMSVHMWCDTPEQAIAVTLGSCNCSDNCTNSERTGTCHIKPWKMERDTGFYDCMECECGYVSDVSDWAKWHFCPNCGRRIVEPTTNDVDAEVGE